MKNLYLYIITCLSIASAYAQDLQNANWYFGTGVGMHFNTSNPALTPTTSQLPYPINSLGNFHQGLDGSTSVSDINGNLLFFSDGRTLFQLWQGTYRNIASFLPEDDAYSGIRTVSIPNPGNSSKYFIVMSKDYEDVPLPGLQYSEIDLSNGLGQMLSLNVSLKDSNNNFINGNYNLSSVALTSALHADGVNYWVIAHVRKSGYSKILSYKVTSAGIDAIPSASFTMPDVYGQNLIVSPNSQKIAIATSNGIYLGDFNGSNGIMNMSLVATTNNRGFNDVAFSPNSNVLYGSERAINNVLAINVDTPTITSSIFSGGAEGMQLGIDGKIYVSYYGFDVHVINNPNNMSNPMYALNSYQLPYFSENDFPQWVHRNKACSSQITGFTQANCRFHWNDTADSYVIEVVGDKNCNYPGDNSADDDRTIYGTITTNDNFFEISDLAALVDTKEFRFRIKTSCGSWSDWCCFDAQGCGYFPYPQIYPNGSCFYGEQPCNAELNLNITEEVLAGNIVVEQASNTITAVNTIKNGADVDYHANNAVFLNPGFVAEAGSVFLAYIEECAYLQARPAGNDSFERSTESQEHISQKTIKNDYVIISPNPSSTVVDISLDNLKMNAITVTSMDGRVMFNKDVKEITSYKLDISNYNIGIYMVTIYANNGRTITGKIIKN